MNKIRYIRILLLVAISLVLLVSCSGAKPENSDTPASGTTAAAPDTSASGTTVAKPETTDAETTAANEKFEITYDSYDNFQYIFMIRNNEGEVIYSGKNRSCPIIEEAEENIIAFYIQHGTGPTTRLGFFCNTETGRFSPEYYCMFDWSNGLFVYGGTEKNVIVKDYFDDGLFYLELTEFNYPLSDTFEAIVGAEFINDGNDLEIQYVTGEDYTLVSDIVHINR